MRVADTDRSAICYFTGTHGDWGGASRIIFNIVRYIDKARFRPVVMLSGGGEICTELDELGIEHFVWQHEYRSRPHLFALRVLQSLRFYRRHRIDIVSLAYSCLGWRPAELLAARLAGIPVIQHCQRVIAKPSPYTKYSSLIATCSNYLARSSSFAPVRTQTINDIVDVSRFRDAVGIRKELGVEATDLVVTFLGRRRKLKGLDLFVALTRLIPQVNVRFLIAGQRTGRPNDDTYGDREFDELLATDSRIRYIGFRPDVEAIYASSDVIVMPSHGEEPCAAVVLEAAASGKPIVATDTGATKELMADGHTGLLVPRGDLGKLAECVNLLLSDAGRRREMGENGIRFAQRRFFSEPLAQLHEIYASLSSRGGRS
jgi:glycosyltransferase involved in cell wall biosynthesis